MEYLIDIVGTCNLRCPSCPVGNFKQDNFISSARARGFMDFSYFEKLISKIISESKNDGVPPDIYLYNWGECLMHPHIIDFLHLLNKENLQFSISSNLNTEIDLKHIVKSNPKMFRVSVSGGFNQTYQKGHKNGDINIVISNLYKIKYLYDKFDIPTSGVNIFYHVYKDNCNDDLLKMYKLCEELELCFMPGYAYFMPIEKVLYHMMGSDKFTEQDKKTMDRMWISIEESAEIASSISNRSCKLQTTQVVINYDGSVPICCGTYDPTFIVENDYLNVERDDLMKKRLDYEFCTLCCDAGINNIAIYNPQMAWEEAVIKKQKLSGSKVLTRMFTFPKISLI